MQNKASALRLRLKSPPNPTMRVESHTPTLQSISETMVLAPSFIWDLWNKWNIRGSVLLSFSLQVFLTFFAPSRKKTTEPMIAFFLWMAYLMADWVVVFGIRLISSVHGHSCARPVEVDAAFQALWASFLFLHLGGPDNFTGFSLEDNSLWRRHLLTLTFQLVIVIYFLVQIFPGDDSLMIPTILLIFAGVIKNTQRILALIRSSLPRLKEWTVLQHKLRGSEESIEQMKLIRILRGGDDDESILVSQAYCFFQMFEGFIADLMITRRERDVSPEHFRSICAMDALRMISIELQFIYEVLHTKRMALTTIPSYIFRFIAFTNVAISFVLFNRWKKKQQHQLPLRALLDVKITYSLFFGGIALEVIALLMLVFSDLNVAWFKVYGTGSRKLNSCLGKLISVMDNLRKPWLSTCEAELNASDTYEVLDTCVIFRRWSESISACNLFSESLKESPRKMHKRGRCWSSVYFSNIRRSLSRVVEKIAAALCQARGFVSAVCIYGRQQMIANTAYVSKIPFIKKLWIFIFEEVRRKSSNVVKPEDVKRMFEARGEMFLESEPEGSVRRKLLQCVAGVNYETSILMWHIATEMWYNRDDQLTSPTAIDDELTSHTARDDEQTSLTVTEEREFSKVLSDYMFYLLVNQHDVVSAVAGIAQVTSGKMLDELRRGYTDDGRKSVKGLCLTLFEKPPADKDSSPLAKGVELAREMERLGLGERKWKVMSGVWVEMLSYAAIHIKGEAHARVLSRGGELLSFVWLLMTHFGCFYSSDWTESDKKSE